MTPHQIFDIYAYKNGYFGNKIKDTMEIFLKDNPHIKLVVIDSIEEIVKGEIGHMECGHACECGQVRPPLLLKFLAQEGPTQSHQDTGTKEQPGTGSFWFLSAPQS